MTLLENKISLIIKARNSKDVKDYESIKLEQGTKINIKLNFYCIFLSVQATYEIKTMRCEKDIRRENENETKREEEKKRV